MPEPKMPLPPFAALRAFHAAAVHGRFRDAAVNLGVTESAISHQVRRLEDFLRTALFDRSGPSARLTAAGRRYLEQIDPALRQIQSATEAMLRPTGRNVVRLVSSESLGLRRLSRRDGLSPAAAGKGWRTGRRWGLGRGRSRVSAVPVRTFAVNRTVDRAASPHTRTA